MSQESSNDFSDSVPPPNLTHLWLETFRRQLLRDDDSPRVRLATPPEPSRVRLHLQMQSFAQAEAAAWELRQGIPQIICLADAPPELSQRLLDFLQGVIYTIDGHQTEVSATVFLLTPQTIKIVQADESE